MINTSSLFTSRKQVSQKAKLSWKKREAGVFGLPSPLLRVSALHGKGCSLNWRGTAQAATHSVIAVHAPPRRQPMGDPDAVVYGLPVLQPLRDLLRLLLFAQEPITPPTATARLSTSCSNSSRSSWAIFRTVAALTPAILASSSALTPDFMTRTRCPPPISGDGKW